MWVCLPACMQVYPVHAIPLEVRRGHQIPVGDSHVDADIQAPVLCKSSKCLNHLNHWAVSQTLVCFLFHFVFNVSHSDRSSEFRLCSVLHFPGALARRAYCHVLTVCTSGSEPHWLLAGNSCSVDREQRIWNFLFLWPWWLSSLLNLWCHLLPVYGPVASHFCGYCSHSGE